MKKTGPSLDWCIVRREEDEKWWVDSISDKENWDGGGFGNHRPQAVSSH